MEVKTLLEEPSSSSYTPRNSQDAVDSAYRSECSLHSRAEHKTSRHIVAKLQDEKLWRSFSNIGNEMIVTKPGRRLFPCLQLSIQGLDPDKEYEISLRFVSADDQRYRYTNMRWVATGESEVVQDEARQVMAHPNSPNTGHFWTKRAISFKSVKITHVGKSRNGNILLHTMHRYYMELEVIPVDAGQPIYVLLKDTSFIAVSAYQNMELTQQKIDHNPFAKGFRYKKRPRSNGVHCSQDGQQDRTVTSSYWQNMAVQPSSSQFIPRPTQHLPFFPTTYGGSQQRALNSNHTSLPMPSGCCAANLPLPPTSPTIFSTNTTFTNLPTTSTLYPLGINPVNCSASSSVYPPKFLPPIRPPSSHHLPQYSSPMPPTNGMNHGNSTLYPPFTNSYLPESAPTAVPSSAMMNRAISGGKRNRAISGANGTEPYRGQTEQIVTPTMASV